MFSKTLILISLCVLLCDAEYDDTKCIVDGARGTCLDLKLCPSAMKDIKLKIPPKICSFNQTSVEPIVCCVDYGKLVVTQPSIPQPSNAQSRTSQPSITQISNSKPIIDQSSVFEASTIQSMAKDQCPPLNKKYAPKTKKIKQGSKAWAKCVEYQETAVFPCSMNSSVRLDFCPPHNATGHKKLLIGGGMVNAEKGQFPHMALLGYGRSHEDAWWQCGGSLISDRFILTAGNCLDVTRERNRTVSNGKVALWKAPEPVTYAALGVLDRSDPLEDWDIYSIKSIIKHPGYKSPIKYDDIALLETDRIVQFSDLVFPACLHVGDELVSDKATAVGWGAEGYHWDKESDGLQHIPVWKVSDGNCSDHYFPHDRFRKGYDSVTQMCYVDDGLPRETCRGDNGGPLQINSPDIYCMALIVGVTSFGNVQCSSIGYPGIYTRVAHYIPWIESVVWP